MFTATMPVWIGILIVIVWSVLVVAAMLLAINKHRAKESLAASKQKIIDTLIFERDDAREQRNRLNRENIDLNEALDSVRILYNNILAQLADRNEALQEAKATIGLLQKDAEHATVPLVEAAPMAYSQAKPAIDKAAQSTPKRTKRSKITGAQ